MAGQPPWLKKKPGNAAEDAADGGMDDAQESPIPTKPGSKKKKGNMNAAIARRLGGSSAGPGGM